MKRNKVTNYFFVILVFAGLMNFTCASPDGNDDSEDPVYYLITFDKNDIGAMGVMTAQAIESGSSNNLMANSFTKTGWMFSGWAITPTGAVVYEDSASYSMETSDVTLYAKWTAPGTYSLRDRGPAGGWIFYDKGSYSDGWRYLEAAPVDQTDRVWGTYNFLVTGADGISIGTGEQNTVEIITNDTGTTGKAADECADYSVTNGGIVYDDWFLPSSAELMKMRENLDYFSVGGFANEIYWSSTEHDKDYVDVNDFGGLSGMTTKNSVRKVRAVRSF